MTFRLKLLLVVGSAMLVLSLVIVESMALGIRQTRDLDEVESHLVPRLELGPKLKAEFDRLTRGMQDAVAAQDADALDDTRQIKDRILQMIGSAGRAMDAAESSSLQSAVQEYYHAAHDVSNRLISGESGEAVVDKMVRMQARQGKAITLIESGTRLERSDLRAGFAAVRSANQRADQLRLATGIGGLVFVLGLSLWVSRSLFRGLSLLSSGFSRFAVGQLNQSIPITTRDELGKLAEEANQMAASLQRLSEQRERNNWLMGGQAGLSDALLGELEVRALAERVLAFLAPRIDAVAAALYVGDEQDRLQLAGQYAYRGRPGAPAAPEAQAETSFRHGEGLVGQAALNDGLLVISDPPSDYLRIRSGLGDGRAETLLFVPLFHQGKTVGVIEFALFRPCSEQVREFLDSVRQMLAIGLEAAKSRAALRDLLARTLSQAERLQAQEEELRLNNQELHVQQRQLIHANEELEQQRRVLSEQNVELDEARRSLQQKAEELVKVSTYKSQFLANMSHELRTPLNGMLLLSHLLAENPSGNLTPKQIEHCKMIHAAGQDLLSLINQVLDLAKIEAGKQQVNLESVGLHEFEEYALRAFGTMAAEKGLTLSVAIDSGLPAAIVTDRQRVERILTNLIGNAIKFTDAGKIHVQVGRPAPDTRFQRADLSMDNLIAFAVSDSGIGIAPEALERVFAPFEQLESRADRRYAGTGLGLALVRESVALLGGEIAVQSTVGSGSTFTCYLPERPRAGAAQLSGMPRERALRTVPIDDDRATLARNEPHLLVIEDDPIFAGQLSDIIHTRGLKALVAGTGEEGLKLAVEHRPRGVLLDVKLPDIDGWSVMQRLRRDPRTHSIPVHFVSGVDAPERGLALGAIGYLRKPATRNELIQAVRALTATHPEASQRVLVVEDNAVAGASIMALLEHEKLVADHVPSAGAALEALAQEQYGCMILDLGLPDLDGLALLETLAEQNHLHAPRVIVHTGRDLTKHETQRLEGYAQAIILKNGDSEERLLEEVRLFVRHVRDNAALSKPSQRAKSLAPDVSLEGKKILLAEDDMRTVYALSALLRGKGAEVLVADTGRVALDLLERESGVQCVLTDLMMPEMDGYELVRRLRQDSRFASLPIVVLTAKAMRGERERCLEAGASEYLAKPVESERLLATLHTWVGTG